MAANMTNNDTGFFLKTSHRFHTNAMTAYKKAWAAVWKDIEPYKLTIAIISIISTLTALLTLPLSYVHTAFIAKKTPKKDTGATGNDAKKGDKTKTAKQSYDDLSKELDSVKKELEQSKKFGTESQKKVKEQNDELEKLQQQRADAEKAKDPVGEVKTDSEAHQQELEAIKQELEAIKNERDEANTKIAELEEKVAAANNTDAPADQQEKLTEAENAKDEALTEVDSLREQLAAAPTQAKVDELTKEIAALKKKNAKSIFANTAKSLVGKNRERKQKLAMEAQQKKHKQELETLQGKLNAADRTVATGERTVDIDSLLATDNGTIIGDRSIFTDASTGDSAATPKHQSSSGAGIGV
ncbi:MAG: hypothetical protein VYC40_05710 [Pseudomonadota bacterium]|nr:hypothetical protein [Pseudomonadota bacterium]